MQSVIPVNLQTAPLLIKTNSIYGSYDKVSLFLLDSQGEFVGEVGITFSRPYTQYFLDWCTSPANFTSNLPTAVDKIWRVSMDRTNGIRFIIHCNDVEVVNALISDETCEFRVWKLHWTKVVEKIYFSSHDNASDDYKVNMTGEFCLT